MDCEHCGQPAQWRYTEVVGGRKHSVTLCAGCARDRGLTAGPEAASGPAPDPAPTASPPSPAAGGVPVPRPPSLPTAPRRCDRCGTTLVALRKSGRVGCPSCYDAFREHLEPLLRRVHGSVRHRGMGRRETEESVRRRQELQQLRVELARAVESEDFETAARLRDRIASFRTAEKGSEPQA